MLNVRVGPAQMHRLTICRYWKFIVAALMVAGFSTFLIQKYSVLLSPSPSKTTAPRKLQKDNKPVAPCPMTVCDADHFSFYVRSGAANVVPPLICFKNELVLGAVRNNVGTGINAAVINGNTGEIINIGSFNMFNGEVEPLIKFLKTIEKGSIVLLASYDEPSSKLNEEARELILNLGSTLIKDVKFRDSWAFVGRKGATVKFEKHLKNTFDNKYDGWPELIEISDCIPKNSKHAQDQTKLKEEGPEEKRL